VVAPSVEAAAVVAPSVEAIAAYVSGPHRHLLGALAGGIMASGCRTLGPRVPGLLKLLDTALEIRDQLVSAVNFLDHLADPGLGIGKLPLQQLLQLLLQPILVRHRHSPPFISV
jgi:hypothetical protein